ncbi:ribosomal protein L1p/L10e family-domain-containing protein [Scheffersomyces amazonensis]|uniref:ribosomal protein L1p/L10e family-domain-containing protein n=1 Tax=Scheffersomyces amazonensis TaxID=1078765 RepID=UPI00315DAECB
MAKTRSKGPVTPKTPTPVKAKKSKITKSSSAASSPLVQKTKKLDLKAKKTKETTIEKSNDVNVNVKEEQKSIVATKVAAKAVSELAKFLQRESASTKETSKSDLFAEEDDDESKNLYLQINTKKFYSSKPQFKPKLIQLSHSIYNQDQLKTCLIIRDQLVTTSEQLETLENEDLPTISQILPLKSLKTEYKNFEKRRQLYSEYDLFLVDDALLNLMPTLLGKVFYGNGNNKIPLPIRVSSTSNNKEFSVVTIKNQLDKCLKSTAFLPPMGVNISIKIGSITDTYTQEDLVENLQDALLAFDKESLRSVSLKTSTSPSLPLFYAEKLYDEDTDVIENIKQTKSTKQEIEGPKLSSFEKGLLELGDAEQVAKIIGKKLSTKSTAKSTPKANKVTKSTKKSKA